MKAGSHLQEAPHAAAQFDPSPRRLGDLAEDFQKRALPRAVATDDADDFARLHFKADIFQGPELLTCPLAMVPRSEAPQPIQWGLRDLGQTLAKRPIAAGSLLVIYEIALAEVFDANGRTRHG